MSVFDYVDSIEFDSSACGCNNYCIAIGCQDFTNRIDISPRYQNLSTVPLEVIEQILNQKHCNRNDYWEPYVYPVLWCHKNRPSDFGAVKNWFAMTRYQPKETIYITGGNMIGYCPIGIGFMINIKDLRVAWYNFDAFIVEYAFDSYNEYVKELNEWRKLSSAEDFSLYWALKRGLLAYKY